MKKFFLRLLAVLGIVVGVIFFWIVTEVTVLMLAQSDYEDGDYAAAMGKWLFLSDYAFSSQAETEIGKLYLEGNGVEQDDFEAVRWFQLAADNYDLGGIYHLGRQYLYGEGIEQNFDEAARLFTLATAYDHPAAKLHLGMMHMFGDGVEQDSQKSETLIIQALESGGNEVRYGLGGFYFIGYSKSQPERDNYDPMEAMKWLFLASADGNQEAFERLEALAQTITSEEAALAAAAADWVEKNSPSIVQSPDLEAEEGEAAADQESPDQEMPNQESP